MFLLQLFIIVLLLIIVYQDFKYRAIRWELLPLLLVGVCFEGYNQIGLEILIHYGSLNLFFFLLQLILLTAYISIKLNRWVNITKIHLGIGDILFFIPLSFMFAPLNLIVFFVTTLLITIIGYFLLQTFFKPNNRTIPLAGILSLYLILIFILEKNSELSRWIDIIQLY